MIPEIVKEHAGRHHRTLRDALQTFMQVVLLKNLRHETARLIGGTALVLGYANPRFSEDLDLTSVADPLSLERSLLTGSRELEGWLSTKATLSAPKKDSRTWKIAVAIAEFGNVHLHIDSQPYPTYANTPLIADFPGFNPIVCNSVAVEEIMADKLVAIALQNYLGGRDLFDLWFHWLRTEDRNARERQIRLMVPKKLRDRRVRARDWMELFQKRLSAMNLQRARVEWKRYLPPDFSQPAILEEIIQRVGKLPSLLLP